MPGGDGGQDGVEEKGPADGGQAGQAAAQPGQEAGQAGLGHVPHSGHGLLGRLGDTLAAVEQAGHADDEPEQAAVQLGAALAGVELRADDRELVQGVHDARAQGGRPDIAEDGHDHQQQRVDGREAVPAQGHHQQVGVVVAELLDHPVADRRDGVAALPTVEGADGPAQYLLGVRHTQPFAPPGCSGRLGQLRPATRRWPVRTLWPRPGRRPL